MKSKIVLFFIILTSFKLFAGSIDQPKLIVGITIRDMRYDYLTRYKDNFKEGGFKRLFGYGAYCRNAQLEYLITDEACGYATIITGSNPKDHGIIANQWYDRLTHKNVDCVFDQKYNAVGSSSSKGQVSPEKLLGTTFGDELKLSNFKRSKVFSISMDNKSAVLSNGHLGDGAFWFDETSGNWMTCSYYMNELPEWLNKFNEKKFPDLYLDRGWYPLNDASKYTASLPDNSIYEIGFDGQSTFPYNLKTLSINKGYKLIKYTPYGNTFTKDMALSAIVEEKLGKDEFCDLLTIDFCASGYVGDIFGIRSMEMEDIYLRLDADIAHLLNSLDELIGKDNYIVYLTSQSGASDSRTFLNELGMKGGTFSASQSKMILNTYLKAIYGIGNWIEIYSGRQFYLNRELIEKNNIDMDQMRSKASELLVEFEAVDNTAPCNAFTNTQFESGFFLRAQNSFHKERSGDILLNFKPGYCEINEQNQILSLSKSNSGYSFNTNVPMVFYGSRIKKADIYRKIGLTDLAATLCAIMGICRPQYCTGEPIQEVIAN